MRSLSTLFSCLILLSQTSFAKKMVLTDLNTRAEVIKNAKVWLAPSWINKNYEFSNSLDVYRGPRVNALDSILDQDNVYCQTTEAHQDMGSTGKNSKFFCNLMQIVNGRLKFVYETNGKPDKIKVKYHEPNKVNDEVFGEILSTRLLWALGFGADRIYTQNNTHCYGCSENPFKDRRLDESSFSTPRSFPLTVIERKFSGNEIVFLPQGKEKPDNASWRQDEKGYMEGWSFMELLYKLPDDPAKKYEQYMHRDALRLLSVFIHHLDLKPQNNRIVCRGEVTANNQCRGDVVLIIQDVGSTFGVKVDIFKLGLDKVRYEVFAKRSFWDKPEKCQVENAILGLDDPSMNDFQASELGRQFLVRLLDGFTEGSAGRKRVEDLFRASRVTEKAPYTIKQWADAFYNRYYQLKYPMGPDSPNFKCPL